MEQSASQILLENILNGTDDCVVGDARIDGAITAMVDEYIKEESGKHALNELNDKQFSSFKNFFENKMSELQQMTILEHIIHNAHIANDVAKYSETTNPPEYLKTNNCIIALSTQGKKAIKESFKQHKRSMIGRGLFHQ